MWAPSGVFAYRVSGMSVTDAHSAENGPTALIRHLRPISRLEVRPPCRSTCEADEGAGRDAPNVPALRTSELTDPRQRFNSGGRLPHRRTMHAELILIQRPFCISGTWSSCWPAVAPAPSS